MYGQATYLSGLQTTHEYCTTINIKLYSRNVLRILVVDRLANNNNLK